MRERKEEKKRGSTGRRNTNYAVEVDRQCVGRVSLSFLIPVLSKVVVFTASSKSYADQVLP